MGKAVAVLATAAGLMAVVGVGPATAATPQFTLSRQANECDTATGTWKLHWTISTPETAQVRLNATSDFGTFTTQPVLVSSTLSGHLFIPNVPNGWSGTITMTVSWKDGSEPSSGNPNIGNVGTCDKGLVTTTTSPVSTAPSSPGQPSTTIARSKPTTTLAPSDPNNLSPSTSVLAQTNGAVVGADPGSGAASSTTDAGGATDTSEAKVALALGPPSSSSSSGSSSVGWIVLAIFVVAAAGGAVLVVMSRRPSSPGDDAPS